MLNPANADLNFGYVSGYSSDPHSVSEIKNCQLVFCSSFTLQNGIITEVASSMEATQNTTNILQFR